MKPRSEADYNRNLAALARRAFEAHELVTCDHADPREATRWRVAKPADRGGWETFYWTEVVVLAGGRIIVHGDIAPVIFAGCSEKGRAAVAWLGECPWFDYVVGKAGLGSGAEISRAHDEEVALAEIAQKIDELRDGYGATEDDEEEPEPMPAHLRDRIARYEAAAGRLRSGDRVPEVHRFLYEEGEDPENFGHIGRVADPRVFYAHAALVRLCALVPTTAPVVSVVAPLATAGGAL